MSSAGTHLEVAHVNAESSIIICTKYFAGPLKMDGWTVQEINSLGITDS